MSLAAAGCGFYATLALFPAISMLISFYGLMFNPQAVIGQLHGLAGLLPPPAFSVIEGKVQQLVSQTTGSLSARLIISLLLTFWSASSGSKSMLSAVNVAYDINEQRGLLHFQAVGLVATFVGLIVSALAIAVLVFLPAVFAFLGLSNYTAGLIHMVSLAMLIGLFAAAIGFLYRYGPSRPRPAHQPILAGVAVATALWLIASALLSYFIAHMGSFGATYGPLGAAVGVMLWFYVSAYAVLLGAELNAQIEERYAALENSPAG
jgi:membrane protein